MREDFEKSRLHASKGQQQNLDIKLDERKNQKVVQLARNPKDARLCNWNCTRDRLRGKAEISRVLWAVWKLAKGGREHQRRVQCYTWGPILLRLLDFPLGERERNSYSFCGLVCAC